MTPHNIASVLVVMANVVCSRMAARLPDDRSVRLCQLSLVVTQLAFLHVRCSNRSSRAKPDAVTVISFEVFRICYELVIRAGLWATNREVWARTTLPIVIEIVFVQEKFLIEQLQPNSCCQRGNIRRDRGSGAL